MVDTYGGSSPYIRIILKKYDLADTYNNSNIFNSFRLVEKQVLEDDLPSMPGDYTLTGIVENVSGNAVKTMKWAPASSVSISSQILPLLRKSDDGEGGDDVETDFYIMADLSANNVIRSMVSFWYNGMRLFEQDGEIVVGNSQNGTTDITLVLDSPLSAQDKFYVEVVRQGV